MIRIFAKKNTTEKVAMLCPRQSAGFVMKNLNKIYGGDWVMVDDLKPNEFIKFDDGLEYKGFHGRDERYCGAIGKFD